eukprot:TRINITY_DN65896_c14_g1_i1.p2 TRINITY_DN65896_c14_g1~~TRINITY_DN65896_c14_g1_i1.p2  ORF type:complete len:135 (-),score=45.65 TRINITY_DN65896_c14_g1_i1:58-408(-)
MSNGRSGSGSSGSASSKSIKNAQRVHNYSVRVDPEEAPADWGALVSLLCGVFGLMMRNKLASWAALFSCMYSVANLRRHEADTKQYMTTVMFALMGLVMNYFGPAARRAAAEAGTQ